MIYKHQTDGLALLEKYPAYALAGGESVKKIIIEAPDQIVSPNFVNSSQGGAMSDLLRFQEAAALLSIAPGTLRGWTSKRKIPFIKLPGSNRVRYSRAALQAWIAEGEVRPIVKLAAEAERRALELAK